MVSVEVAGEDSVVETVGVQEEDSVEETVVDEVDSVAVEVRIYPTLLQRFSSSTDSMPYFALSRRSRWPWRWSWGIRRICSSGSSRLGSR